MPVPPHRALLRWSAAAIAIAALAAAARAQTPTSPAGAGANRGAADTTGLAAFVDSVMAAEMAREGIPGAAFVFVRDGRVVYAKGYGLANVAERRPADPETTIWRIGSISKTFTAL